MNYSEQKRDLHLVRDWECTSDKNVKELIDFIYSIWEFAEEGYFKLSGKRVLKLELHTGGWSGNEEIVLALQKNLFWFLYWQKSERGGHYYFKIRLRGKGKK